MLHHIVAHSADPDGIVTHAILRRSLLKTQHHFADYDNLAAILEGLLTAEPGKLVIADISCNDRIASPEMFESLKKRHRNISWYDHHTGSYEQKGFLARYTALILSTNQCAAQLVSEVYAAKDAYAQFLAHLGQIHDFERKEDQFAPQAYALQDIIASEGNLHDLVSDLATEKVWDEHRIFTPFYQGVLDKFSERKNQAYSLLEQSVEQREIAGLRVAVAYSDPILYMKPAYQHLQECLDEDCIFVMYQGKSNVLALASKKIGKRILDFLAVQGGGGRGHGGGFVLDHPVSAETYQQDKEEILRRFGNYFRKEA